MKEDRKNECSWHMDGLVKICSRCGHSAEYVLKITFFGITKKSRTLCKECALKWSNGEITL